MQVKKQQLEPSMKQQISSELGEEYNKAVDCHPVYLTCMQSTSCEVPGSQTHKLNQDCMKLRCLFLESYVKPQQHIRNQRHHFADKGPYSQSYGFSSGHVWM